MSGAGIRRDPDAGTAMMCDAVSDYRPQERAEKKIKRNTDDMTLTLVPNPDIAAALGKIKRPGQLLVGFALETDNEEQNALSKMQRKNLDFIVLNSLQEPGAGVRCDTNRITILSRDGEKQTFGLKSKKEVAGDIVDKLIEKLHL